MAFLSEQDHDEVLDSIEARAAMASFTIAIGLFPCPRQKQAREVYNV